MKTSYRDGIPIALGYFAVSFPFGMMASAAGFPIWAAVLISMTNLTSAGQFAGLQVMIAAGGGVEMFLTQLVINLRYALMSLSLSQKCDESMSRPFRALTAFGITDEIFAVASSKKGSISRGYLLRLISLPYLGWTAGTLLGAAASQILPAAVCSALGIAIYGMFIAIILPPMKQNRSMLFVVLLAAALSCILYYVPLFQFLSQGFSVIVCAVLAAGLAALLFPVKEEDNA